MGAVGVLPAGVFLELAFPQQGVTHRFADDGRYLVIDAPGEPERAGAVLSQREGRRSDLSPAARDRLRAAARPLLDLPERLDDVEPTARPPRTPDGARPQRQPVRVRVRDGARSASVTIAADPRWPETLGPLRAVIDAMDVEAIGYYRDE